MTTEQKELENKPILMIEGINIKELGDVFAGYYLNHSEEVIKIINLYRNQGREIEREEIRKKINELNENAGYRYGDEVLQELLNSLGEKLK